MRVLNLPVLLTALLLPAPVFAADAAAEAQLSFSLGFGAADGLEFRSVSLGYRNAYRDDGPTLKLMELRSSGPVSAVLLTGVPVFARDYRVNQNAEPSDYAPGFWTWVLLGAGTVAIAAYVAAEVDDDTPGTGGSGV